MKDLQFEIEPGESTTIECFQPVSGNKNISVSVFVALTQERKLLISVNMESPNDIIQIEIENGIIKQFEQIG